MPKKSSSHLWKGVVKGQKHLQEGLAWNLGDGKSIQFQMDKWLSDFGHQMDYAMCNLSEDDLSKMVEDFVTLLGVWDQRKLKQVLLNDIYDRIATFMPPFAGSNPNIIKWGLMTNGRFLIKSAYGLISNQQAIRQNDNLLWKKFW